MRIVEVVHILLRTNDGGHGRDVETKQHAANGGDHGHKVDIVYLRETHRG